MAYMVILLHFVAAYIQHLPREEVNFPVKLREEQAGISGTNVTEWTVEKDGKWRWSSFTLSGGKVLEGSQAQKSGELSKEQLATMLANISKQKPSDLPERLGSPVKVNAHNYVIQIGRKKLTVMGLPPRLGDDVKENILEAAPKQDIAVQQAWNRAAEIGGAITSKIKPE